MLRYESHMPCRWREADGQPTSEAQLSSCDGTAFWCQAPPVTSDSDEARLLTSLKSCRQGNPMHDRSLVPRSLKLRPSTRSGGECSSVRGDCINLEDNEQARQNPDARVEPEARTAADMDARE